MDLGDFLEQDMIMFLDAQVEEMRAKKEVAKPMIYDDADFYSIQRDYGKEVRAALDDDNLAKAKHIFDDLKDLYNKIPTKNANKRKAYLILEELYTIIKNYLEKRNKEHSLAEEIFDPNITKAFSRENKEKTLMEEKIEQSDISLVSSIMGPSPPQARAEASTRLNEAGMQELPSFLSTSSSQEPSASSFVSSPASPPSSSAPASQGLLADELYGLMRDVKEVKERLETRPAPVPAFQAAQQGAPTVYRAPRQDFPGYQDVPSPTELQGQSGAQMQTHLERKLDSLTQEVHMLHQSIHEIRSPQQDRRGRGQKEERHIHFHQHTIHQHLPGMSEFPGGPGMQQASLQEMMSAVLSQVDLKIGEEIVDLKQVRRLELERFQLHQQLEETRALQSQLTRRQNEIAQIHTRITNALREIMSFIVQGNYAAAEEKVMSMRIAMHTLPWDVRARVREQLDDLSDKIARLHMIADERMPHGAVPLPFAPSRVDEREYTEGLAKYAQGQADEALLLFKGIIARNPQHLAARIRLAEVEAKLSVENVAPFPERAYENDASDGRDGVDKN